MDLFGMDVSPREPFQFLSIGALDAAMRVIDEERKNQEIFGPIMEEEPFVINPVIVKSRASICNSEDIPEPCTGDSGDKNEKTNYFHPDNLSAEKKPKPQPPLCPAAIIQYIPPSVPQVGGQIHGVRAIAKNRVSPDLVIRQRNDHSSQLMKHCHEIAIIMKSLSTLCNDYNGSFTTKLSRAKQEYKATIISLFQEDISNHLLILNKLWLEVENLILFSGSYNLAISKVLLSAKQILKAFQDCQKEIVLFLENMQIKIFLNMLRASNNLLDMAASVGVHSNELEKGCSIFSQSVSRLIMKQQQEANTINGTITRSVKQLEKQQQQKVQKEVLYKPWEKRLESLARQWFGNRTAAREPVTVRNATFPIHSNRTAIQSQISKGKPVRNKNKALQNSTQELPLPDISVRLPFPQTSTPHVKMDSQHDNVRLAASDVNILHLHLVKIEQETVAVRQKLKYLKTDETEKDAEKDSACADHSEGNLNKTYTVEQHISDSGPGPVNSLSATSVMNYTPVILTVKSGLLSPHEAAVSSTVWKHTPGIITIDNSVSPMPAFPLSSGIKSQKDKEIIRFEGLVDGLLTDLVSEIMRELYNLPLAIHLCHQELLLSKRINGCTEAQ